MKLEKADDLWHYLGSVDAPKAMVGAGDFGELDTYTVAFEDCC